MAKKAAKAAAPAQPAAPPEPLRRPGPVFEARLGRIRATVWKNHHKEKGFWFSVTLQRAYRDGTGEWKTSTSFGREDLPLVAKVADMAHTWIYQHGYDKPAEETGVDLAAEAGNSNGEGASSDIPF